MMPTLEIKVGVTDKGTLSTKMAKRLQAFTQSVRQTAVESARIASAESESVAKRPAPGVAKRPRPDQPRKGRPNTPPLAAGMKWQATKSGGVQFSVKTADATYKAGKGSLGYWLIQEVGTGEKAILHQGGAPNPQGRPSAGASYSRTVPSQVGRPIRFTLAWGVRGKYVRPSKTVRNQQLQLASSLDGLPQWPHKKRAKIIIGKEIVGRHMVQRGSEKGFTQFRLSLRKAGRDVFKGHPSPSGGDSGSE